VTDVNVVAFTTNQPLLLPGSILIVAALKLIKFILNILEHIFGGDEHLKLISQPI